MRSLSVIALALVLSIGAFAQSVTVTSQKRTYRRPNPIGDHKRTFTVVYPKVKAASPALARKIESAISYRTVMDLNVEEEISEVQWLAEADFRVDYNKRGLLCVTLLISGAGAYPSGVSRTVVVSLATGRRLLPRDVFINLDELARVVNEKQKAEIERAIKEINEIDNPAELFEGKEFRLEDLNEFAADDKGVTFIYDYGFPHVIQALQPEGRFAFTWTEIKRFIRPGGPFARFVVK